MPGSFAVPWLPLALLSAGFAAGAPAVPPAEEVAVLAYEGKWSTDGDPVQVTVELSLAPIDALSALERRLPSLPPSGRTITVSVVDAAPADAPDPPPVEGLTVRPFVVDPAAPERVTLYAEPFFAGTVDTFHEAARALTEALLRLRIGPSARTVPPWLVDGLAQWVLAEDDRDDGPGAAPPAYGWHLADEELAPGLETGAWSPWRRFEDRMAVRTFVRLAGADAPDRLVAALRAGKDPLESLEVLTAHPWETFAATARADARRVLASRRSEATAPLLDGYRAARAGDWLEALDRAQEVIRQEDRTLHPEALLLGARALNALGQPKEASKPIEHFFHLLPKGSGVGDALLGRERLSARPLLGRIHLERARARRALGDDAGAREDVATFLRLSPEGEWLDEALRVRDG